MMTKQEAVKELEQYDHCLLTPQAVKEIGEPFGFYFVREYVDNRSEFKGLNLGPKNKEGDKVMGLGAHELAVMLCQKEKVKYREMYGRGSQLRECCEALKKHLGA